MDALYSDVVKGCRNIFEYVNHVPFPKTGEMAAFEMSKLPNSGHHCLFHSRVYSRVIE
jgi:hypothetical protein